MRFAVLLLAAGLSRRFGDRNKLLVAYRGRALVAHAAEAARSLGATQLVATVSDPAVARVLQGFDCLDLPEPERGMGHSLALGARHVLESGAEGCLVLLGDMPCVSTAHLLAVIEAGRHQGVAASLADGVRMPPAWFSRSELEGLAHARGDRGGRGLLAGLPDAALVAAPAGDLVDIDTPEALEAAATGQLE